MGREIRILSDMKRILFVASLAVMSTGCAAKHHIAPSLAITTEACEKLATEWDSPDVADACRKGNEIAPILEILLKERAKARAAASESK